MRLVPQPWRVVEKYLLARGWTFARQDASSHRIYTKTGCPRPVVLPAHDEVQVGTLMSILRTAGSRDDFLEWMQQQ